MAWVGRINGLLSVTVVVGSGPEEVAPEEVCNSGCNDAVSGGTPNLLDSAWRRLFYR